MHNFNGIGCKIAEVSGLEELKNVAKQRGYNPLNWVTEGWRELGEFEPNHFATTAKSKGWLGTGSVTRHFPVGPKSIVVGFGLLGAPTAFAKEDPTGEGLSRARRVGGFIGSNALGLATTLPARVGILPSIALGFGGSIVGEHVGRRIGGLFEGKQPVPLDQQVRG